MKQDPVLLGKGRGYVHTPLSFLSRVKESGACWLWPTVHGPTGYGRVGYRNRTILAHRLSWILFRGRIPKDLHVLHRCDVRACVNPEHLFLGTQADNMRDRDEKGRQMRGAKHYAAKLSEEDVREIRRLRATHSLRELASRFAITKASVQGIVARRTWRHV